MIEAHVVAALVNSTWQSALVALVAFVALRLFTNASATVRCLVLYGVLAIVAVLPFADLAASLNAMRTPTPMAWRSVVRPVTARASLALFAPPAAFATSPAEPSLDERVALGIGAAAPWLERGWLAIALLLAGRLVFETLRLLVAKRRVRPIQREIELPIASRAFRIGASDGIETPCVLGLFDPVVVLPWSLARSLSDDDLARVVLHEAAHVQRRDDWIHLLERILRVVLFFNPLVYVIGRRLAVEREIACDDLAVARSGNRLAYASCLSSLAAYLSSARPAPTPALFSGRRQLVVRVERLLDSAHDGSTRIGGRALVAFAAIGAVAFVVAHFGIPVRAQTAMVDAPRMKAQLWTPRLPVASVVHKPQNAPRARVARSAPVRRTAPREPAVVESKRGLPVRILRPVSRRTVSEIVLLRKHDVDLKFVADVDAAVHVELASEAIVALREHDVSPEYMASLIGAGVRTKCGFDFVRMHDHGVTPEVVAVVMRRFGEVRVKQLVRQADAGV